MGKTKDKLNEMLNHLTELRRACHEFTKIPASKLEFDAATRELASQVKINFDLSHSEFNLEMYFRESALRYHYQERYYVTELDPDSTFNLSTLYGGTHVMSGPWGSLSSAENELKRKQEYEAKKNASNSALRGKPRTYAIVGYNPKSDEWRKMEPATQTDRRTP